MRNPQLTEIMPHANRGTDAPIVIVVKGRFNPHTVALRAGHPHVLIFRREETAPCSEQVFFPTIGRSVTLPAFEDVTVELPPLAPGNYAFTCGRAALHGKIVVRGNRRHSVRDGQRRRSSPRNVGDEHRTARGGSEPAKL